VLLLPALVFAATFIVYPLFSSVWQSLHSNKTGGYIGLDNYRRFIDDPLAEAITVHTYVRAVFGVIPSYVVGLAVALAVTQRAHLVRVFTLLALLPFVISPPVGIGMWKLLLDPQSGVLPGLGLTTTDVFTNSHLVWPTLIYINTWGSFQLYTMILIAALRRIPPELYEAAAIDGASRWQQFRSVTMPGIARVSVAVCAVHFIASFQEFNLIHLATGGGPLNETQSLPTYAYQSAFTDYDMNYATALTTITTVLMAVTLLLLALVGLGWVKRSRLTRRLQPYTDRLPQLRLGTRRRRSVQLDAAPDRRRVKRVRQDGRKPLRSRYFWLLLVGLYAVGPILFLLSVSLDVTPGGSEPMRLWPRHFAFTNYWDVLSNPDLWSNTNIALPPLALNFVNSILVTAGTTAIVVVAGSLGGYALSRMRMRPARWLVAFFLLLQLVPMIVLVFPLYSLLAHIDLLGSQLGLILATTVISLPMGVLFFNVFFSDLPPEMTEAAALDGAGTLRTLWSIAAPLSRPAFGAVAAFALINTWNEFLLATSLVTNSRLRTLPPALNQYMSSYSFASSTSPGMQAVYLLIPIAAAVVLLTLTQRSLTSAYEGGAVKG
jgi:multiple sugar transport system permease protein